MSEEPEGVFYHELGSADEAFDLVGRLYDVAGPETVFSDPVEAGDFVLVTATEAVVSLGAGYGGGGGYDPEEIREGTVEASYGSGGGGGGGGLAVSRPVAAITVGPGGTTVEPIVDQTKLGIAFLTTFAAMVISLAQTVRFLRSKSR